MTAGPGVPESWRAATQSFANTPTSGACGAAAPTYKYFTHTCTLTNGGQGYTAKADGIAGGRTAGFTFTINEQNARATTAAPTNWTTTPMPATCFITRKGSC